MPTLHTLAGMELFPGIPVHRVDARPDRVVCGILEEEGEGTEMIELIIDLTGKALFVVTLPWVVYFFWTVLS